MLDFCTFLFALLGIGELGREVSTVAIQAERDDG